MIRKEFLVTLLTMAILATTAGAEQNATPNGQLNGESNRVLSTEIGQDSKDVEDPCYSKYCMSIFTKTRTAKTVGKGRLSVALKYQYCT